MKLLVVLLIVTIVWLLLTMKPQTVEKFDKHDKVIEMGKYKTTVNVYDGNTNETMVLIHGIPLDQTTWDPVIKNLQSRMKNGSKVPTIVTYDLRGCGTSSAYPIDDRNVDAVTSHVEWHVSDLVQDLEMIRKKLDVSTISIAGYDFGGYIAQAYAMLYPSRIQRLLLLQTSATPIDESKRIESVLGDIHNGNRLSAPTIQGVLCQWFYITDEEVCPVFHSDPKKHISQTDSSGYKTVKALLSQTNAKSYLQYLKLWTGMNQTASRWIEQQYPFEKITVLSTTDDNYIPPNISVKLMDAVQVNNVANLVPIIIVGQHYFTFETSDYTAELIKQ